MEYNVRSKIPAIEFTFFHCDMCSAWLEPASEFLWSHLPCMHSWCIESTCELNKYLYTCLYSCFHNSMLLINKVNVLKQSSVTPWHIGEEQTVIWLEPVGYDNVIYVNNLTSRGHGYLKQVFAFETVILIIIVTYSLQQNKKPLSVPLACMVHSSKFILKLISVSW